MTMSPIDSSAAGARQRRVRRTAWTVAAIALLVYLLFIGSGVFAWRGL